MNIMQRNEVVSSNIKSIGYDLQAMILEIEFKNGHVYQYSGVPGNIYQALMNAQSHGTYLHQFVMNRYPYVKIR